MIAEDEYKTESTLPPFASHYLAKDYKIDFVFDAVDDKNSLTGSSVIADADILFISARRRAFPASQLAAIRHHIATGKSVVGIRTASHAFALRPGVATPAGHDVWPTFDADVLGGHYTNHHKVGPVVKLATTPDAASHPILTGVDVSQLVNKGTLYKVSPLADSAQPLVIGTIPGEASEPVAWTNLTATGGRVFYTSLGHPDDFAQPLFLRLLRNAIDWTASRDVASTIETSSTEPIPFPK